MKNDSVTLEKNYHNSIAEDFLLQRKYDFIWEIPERLFLLKRKYFQNKSVVEMGCGPSFWLSKVAKRDKLKIKKYLGVDISKNMILLAKKNYPKGFFIVGDMTNINLSKSSADSLLSLGALHHAEDKYKALKNWIRILKRGGYLLMREPTFEALKKGSGASPTEEGIEVDKIENYLLKNGLIIKKNLYFSSNLFHLINRLLNRIFSDFWRKNEYLWYPVMILDVLISNTLGNFIPFLRGEACIIVAQKV